MAVQSLQQRCNAAILNLRSLNPYVANALADWSKGSDLKATVPRMATASSAWRPDALAGASSFGMGGTNAHLLTSVPTPRQPVAAKHSVWMRSR